MSKCKAKSKKGARYVLKLSAYEALNLASCLACALNTNQRGKDCINTLKALEKALKSRGWDWTVDAGYACGTIRLPDEPGEHGPN